MVCVCIILKSGNFLTCTINGGEERDEEIWKRRKKGREREEKKKERVVVMLGLIKWVPHFYKYLQKCHWATLFET